MQWIKAHLNLVVAGTVGLLGLVALVLGATLTNVASEMSSTQSLFGSLQSVGGPPKSALDDLRRQQIARHETLVKELAQRATKTGEHEPLEPALDIFPEEKPSKQNAFFEFKTAFKRKQQELLTTLKAQDKPTDAEIKDATETILRLKAQAQAESEKDAPGEKKPKSPGGPGPAPVARPNPIQGGTFDPRTQLGQLRPDATPEERVRESPEARASVAKAHDAWCYAAMENLDDRRQAIIDVDRPRSEDMWYAQVSLWVQEDVLRALGELNEARAKTLAEADRWVGNMPFKHLLMFKVAGYVPAAQGSGGSNPYAGSSGGTADEVVEGVAPRDASAVVSKRGCGETVDVVQFSVLMIVETKALPEVIDKICESGFYNVLQVRYETVQPEPDLVGYIYGSQPVIRVWLLCEGSFLRTGKDAKSYEKLMPKKVREDIKAGLAVGEGGAPGAGPSGGFNTGRSGQFPAGRPGMGGDPRMIRGRPGMGPP